MFISINDVVTMDLRLIIRIASILLMLYLFYYIGLPPIYSIFLGALAIVILLVRGHAYERINTAIDRYLSFMSNWPSWSRKLVVFLIFLVFLIVLKQAAFLAMKFAGMDIQQAMIESINKSMQG